MKRRPLPHHFMKAVLLPLLFSCLLQTAIHASTTVAQRDLSVFDTRFLINEAALGGGDHTARDLNRTFLEIADPGATLTLTGIAWASAASGTDAEELTITITDPGPDGIFGTQDDLRAGEFSARLAFDGAGVYVWEFPEPVVIPDAQGDLQITLSADGPIRWKTEGRAGGVAGVKLSIGGFARGGVPRPDQRIATSSGYWDEINWQVTSRNQQAIPAAELPTVIGRQQRVAYRGQPEALSLQGLQLGESPEQLGQGILIVEEGNLSIKGELSLGVGDSENDSFIFVYGGRLMVEGDASFGRFTPRGDGSLIVAGGQVAFARDLSLGSFVAGGSMLRFHNPGSSVPVTVGGTLHLHRAALDLTFDEDYVHSPGTVIPLIRYQSRDGQFLNIRDGDTFLRGPNRFRVDYDVGGDTLTLTALPNWSPDQRPPNVILVFTDDQGYSDIQINEHPHWGPRYPMPRLQDLTDRGVRFTDAYVSGGVCHPARAGLISGIYQQRLGNENNLGAVTKGGLAPGQATVPNLLQSLGFRTYGVAKWHLGETIEYHPNVRGFDRWYGMWGGSRSYYESFRENTVFQDQVTPKPEDETGEYLTDRIGTATVDFIAEHLETAPDQPFFIYVSLTAPHGPNDMQFTDERFERLEKEFGLTQEDYLDTPFVFDTRERTQLERYRLAGMTLAIDENIGKIVDKLEASGLMEDTIIVYLNDNGGPGYTQRWGGNWSYNEPLRGYKGGSMLEGAIRVPATFTWTGTVPGGQVVDAPIIALDLMKTFANTGGAPAEALEGLDGIDFLPLLRDGTPIPEGHAHFWRMSGPQGGGSAVREGDWKLHITDDSQRARLYNLRDDIGESRDLSRQNPELAARLMQRLVDWDAGLLMPFFAQSGIIRDEGLEYYAAPGVYRLNHRGSDLAWKSFVFRTPYALDQAFHLRAQFQSMERHAPASGQIAYGLGNSDERDSLVRIIVDYEQRALVVIDGLTGKRAAAPIRGTLPRPAELIIDYRPESQTLSVQLRETRVSLALDGAHDAFTHFAVGVAAMAGDLSGLIPTRGQSIADFEATSDFPGLVF
ncbi:MAG: hypothetical protein EA353_01425 [Puniceicoccaceae bacterium]|nr:MAG: hypothetical protein EA353_01425 [Puniceicoccaceae bacterium]